MEAQTASKLHDEVELESVLTALGVSDINALKGADDEVWEKKAAAIAAADDLPSAVKVVVGDDVKVFATPSQRFNIRFERNSVIQQVIQRLRASDPNSDPLILLTGEANVGKSTAAFLASQSPECFAAFPQVRILFVFFYA
jgi:hypothetical protein